MPSDYRALIRVLEMAESEFEGDEGFPRSKEPGMDEEVVGKIGEEVGGDIFIPMESELSDEGTLDEPVATTLVSRSQCTTG